MEWLETFPHNEIKPSENDGDLKFCIKLCYQWEICEIQYHFCYGSQSWKRLHKSKILHDMQSYECKFIIYSLFAFEYYSGIRSRENQNFSIFANLRLSLNSYSNTYFHVFFESLRNLEAFQI